MSDQTPTAAEMRRLWTDGTERLWDWSHPSARCLPEFPGSSCSWVLGDSLHSLESTPLSLVLTRLCDLFN